MKHATFFNREKKVVSVIIAIAAILLLTFVYHCGFQKVCKVETLEKTVRSAVEVKLPKGTLYAEIVDTPSSRAQGLSGRNGLAENGGMLFVFEQSGKYGFWMKDMLFPIDMIWINEDGVIVHVERGVSPDTYTTNPPQVFINEPNAKYVLELGSGMAEKYGVYLGMRVKIGNK
jgi:uncharacterized membrane protein (UPF0127 family)